MTCDIIPPSGYQFKMYPGRGWKILFLQVQLYILRIEVKNNKPTNYYIFRQGLLENYAFTSPDKHLTD